jgi:response regulator of citrate/malate metabolism
MSFLGAALTPKGKVAKALRQPSPKMVSRPRLSQNEIDRRMDALSGSSKRKTAAQLGLSRTTIQKTVKKSQARGTRV